LNQISLHVRIPDAPKRERRLKMLVILPLGNPTPCEIEWQYTIGPYHIVLALTESEELHEAAAHTAPSPQT